jgi:predicted nucleotidyltransferase
METGLKEKIIEDIRGILRLSGRVKKAILFGSRANGSFKESSDIDIALIEDIDLKLLFQIRIQIDELYLPWKLDLLDYSAIKSPELIHEIEKGIDLLDKDV